MTLTFEESDRNFLVGDRLHTEEGRAELVAEGVWTQEQADKRKKQQHRRGAKTRSGPFIGWDGEGVTEDNNIHKYIMLCNSEGDILRAKKGQTLRTTDCLNLLCDVSQRHPNANHVVYGGSYDANMMLSDLSLYDCQELAQEGVVQWGDFRIAYRPRKFFQITRYKGKHYKENKTGGIILWDVIGFFQQSFVRTLAQWEIGELKETAFVQDMKYSRSGFDRTNSKEIERYCFIECKQLVEVMTKLRNHTRAIDLTPLRYDGAGALSTRILQKYGIRKYMSRDIPAKVNRAAQYAYFGGRIECCQYGNYEHTVYAHDIRSAYPSAMTKLPCLKHGRWIHGKKLNEKYSFQMCYISWHMGKGNDDPPTIHPFPFRGPQDGICFQAVGSGWYWRPEIDAAIKHLDPSQYQITESWSFVPGCKEQPFSYIPEVYEHRKRLKNANNLAQIILKLALNGTYGKLAQQVGSKDGEPPTYHQLEWAGYITSYTRALIYNLAMINPASVISFETDGLYSTVPLAVDNGKDELGSWEVTEYKGITYVQSGVYWVNDPKGDKRKNDWKPKYRGFDAPKVHPVTGKVVEGLGRDFVMDCWREGVRELESTSTRFGGLCACSISPQSFVEWRTWTSKPRKLRLYPVKGKRMTAPRLYAKGERHPELQLVQTVPTISGIGESMPHKLAWIDKVRTTLEDPFYREDMEVAEDEDNF